MGGPTAQGGVQLRPNERWHSTIAEAEVTAYAQNHKFLGPKFQR